MASSKRPNGRRLVLYGAGLAILVLADPTVPTFGVGAGLALLGELLRLWAAGHLEKNRSLTTTGPYAHVKNPLYLGSLILFCGIVLAAARPEPPTVWVMGGGYLVGLLAFFLIYFPRKLRIESARLRRRFGSEYERYDAAVPALIPSWRPAVPREGRRWLWRRVVRNSEHWTAAAILAVFAYLALRL